MASALTPDVKSEKQAAAASATACLVNRWSPKLVAVRVVALAAELGRGGAAVTLILIVRARTVIGAVAVIGRSISRSAVVGGATIIGTVVIGVSVTARGDRKPGADDAGKGRGCGR